MDVIRIKTRQEKINLCDCVVYLLQHCETYEKSEIERKFCLDVAEKALFLFNLCPNAFGRTKKDRDGWFDAINKKIELYKSDAKYHLEREK